MTWKGGVENYGALLKWSIEAPDGSRSEGQYIFKMISLSATDSRLKHSAPRRGAQNTKKMETSTERGSLFGVSFQQGFCYIDARLYQKMGSQGWAMYLQRLPQCPTSARRRRSQQDAIRRLVTSRRSQMDSRLLLAFSAYVG